eukprot:TRINITY_DN13027_c2_g1_i6.p1 TRINITY_DN13027_c2_g1~~TRINITY_DN13027_c2_g1_i6.p1  ORF type:complete len:205 (-),score=-11.06 TRINITY_DN13027_c2_g1_i6:236-850(-)
MYFTLKLIIKVSQNIFEIKLNLMVLINKTCLSSFVLLFCLLSVSIRIFFFFFSQHLMGKEQQISIYLFFTFNQFMWCEVVASLHGSITTTLCDHQNLFLFSISILLHFYYLKCCLFVCLFVYTFISLQSTMPKMFVQTQYFVFYAFYFYDDIFEIQFFCVTILYMVFGCLQILNKICFFLYRNICKYKCIKSYINVQNLAFFVL